MLVAIMTDREFLHELEVKFHNLYYKYYGVTPEDTTRRLQSIIDNLPQNQCSNKAPQVC